MRIFYFVHVTGTDSGISGVPRVVRNLARELARLSEVEVVPVFWRHDLQAIAHAEQKLLDNLSRHGGPSLTAAPEARQPVGASPGNWLLIAEVPHLQSHLADYPSVHLDEVVGAAFTIGLRVALVFHDILPLIFGVGGKAGKPFTTLSPADLSARGESAERLAFARYAHATSLVDLVLPVSRTAGETLRAWLTRHGHRPQRLPPIVPALLPEEVFGARRGEPLGQAQAADGPIEFVAVGLVNAQKNQLAAMAAFLKLAERRPDLDLRLHLIGHMGADVAVPASLMARRAKGRMLLHGRLPDGQVREITARARATVFVSLAEGFGLPVAESLWRGKPCLCSDSGSIGEIARGGGCLTVDPRSIEAISAGFETLATDSVRYEELLQEIAARRFKTWKLYAGQIADALSVVSFGGVPEIVEAAAMDTGASTDCSDSSGDGEEPLPERDAALVILAADWLVHAAYSASSRSRSLFYAGAINYDAERDGAVDEETLFFGPHVSLCAGRYAFTFDGEIEGELKLALTAHMGAMRILETTLRSFDEPIVFELAVAVEQFEIVGARTPQLRSLTLRCAWGELRASSAEPSGAMGPHQALGRAALSMTIPASRLRVHDAYNSAHGNLLRDGSAIAFERARHGGVAETTLFFGPYIRLDPGRYHLRFDGKLEGSIRLQLTRDSGGGRLRELVLTSFEDPVLLEIDEAAEDFEAVGNRRDDTRSLRLNAIEIAPAPAVESDGVKSGQTLAEKGRGSLLARVLGRG